MQKIMIATVVAIAGGVQGQNLLSNGGFEVGINYDGNDSGNWNAFFGGADFQQAEVVAETGGSGAQAMQIGTFNTANTFVGITQTVPVSGGSEYTFDFLAREVIQNGIFAEYRIEWKDAGGAFIGGQFDLNTNLDAGLTSSFQPFSLTATAPAGAATGTVVIAVQTFGSAAPFEGFIQIDDASFIPAPATAALMGLGGLAAARRRRA
ncbi:MAG: PEP-CTERM sorting domain-containing protein [Planctomycetota bacterium]